MEINFETILSFLTSHEVQQNLFGLKLGFLIISGVLLISIIVLILKTHYYQWWLFYDASQFLTRRPFGTGRMTMAWNKILNRLKTGSEREYKIAVIDADKMFDYSLKRMGYMGQTLEEKLSKLTSATLPNIEDIHQAHKVRNNIVHSPDYKLSLEEATTALDAYKKAFNDLQILT